MAKLKPYTKYKDSGLKWLGDIPEDWSLTPIRSLFRDKSDKGHPEEKLLSVYREYGVIEKDSRDDNHNVAGQDLSNYKRVKENDLVVNKMKTWQGSLGISKYQGIVSPAYITASLISDEVDPEFVNYLLRIKNYVFEYNRLSYGVRVGQWDMHFEDFKKISVLLPPKATQTQISKYLDRKIKDINKYVKKLKKEIALLKEHRQKIISQAVTCGLDENGKLRKKPEWSDGDPMPKGWKDSGVEWLGLIPEGWEQIKVKYIGDAFIGITYSPKDLVDNEDEGILVLRASNIKDGKLVFNDNVYVDLKVEKKYLVKEGDLLICSRSGSRDLIGKNVYIDKDLGFSFGAFMTVLRSKHSEYLSWFLASDFFKSQSGLYATTTINQLTLGTLNNMLVTLPKIKTEREEIIFFLKDRTAELDTEISKIQDQIEFIKEYKQSLISKVVTGKIDVRNINNNLSED